MRTSHMFLVGTALAASGPAFAAEQLKFGKSPPWVLPQIVSEPSAAVAEAPLALLLVDEQVQLQPGKLTTYSELAMKIQKPEGLSAGNISLAWDPATDTVTINKLEIHRGNQVIDVLAGGQKFTTMRRETSLEAAMLDGYLTANIQPEGLQQGDVIDLASTTEHADPVTGSHVEANFAQWTGVPIRRAHVRFEWPASMKLNIQAKGVTVQPVERGSSRAFEISAQDVQPIIAPKDGPVRFSITRLGEATDFASWSEVARLMQPLFRKAEAIPATGPLHEEVEKIRLSPSDQKRRAEAALQLVQDRIRYVALAMGQGGLVPADAETTWSRRFGDCKAKTALLLGILHSLGVEAEPLLVQSQIGDAIDERLPMMGYFDHVLVRAHIGGRTYYLDGTRTGDTDIDQIEVPNFGWALPVLDRAQLVQLLPPPLNRPKSETKIAIDASAGIFAPADVSADQVVHGDLAVTLNSGLASLTEAQRTEYFDRFWKEIINDLTPAASSFTFNKAARELRLSVQGKLKLDWSGGFFHLPQTSIGYAPDLDRSEGPFHDSPVAVGHPIFNRAETKIRLPAAFFPPDVAKLVPEPVHKILIGVEYSRTQSANPDGMVVQTTTRSLVPEVSYKDAVAESGILKSLADGDVSVRLPANYRATSADLLALKGDMSGSAEELVTRGNILLESHHFEEAAANFDKALELDSKNVGARSNRAIAYSWMRKFDLAKSDIEAALSIDPTNAVALRARGLSAELSANCAQAIEAYTASLRAEASNFALGHRAICESAQSRDDEALADAALAIKADPSWLVLRLLRANIFVKQAKNEEVAAEAKLATAENPQSAYAYVLAGGIYARLKRLPEAMKAFDAALSIKPEAFIYINRARARPFSDKSGRLDDLDAALKLEPNNSEGLAEKAEQLAVDGEYQRAVQLYDQVIKTAPEEKYYKIRRAVFLFKAGNPAAARKLFANLRAEAASANDFNSLCWAKATAGILLDVALDECGEALKREPDKGPYLDSRALVELRLGNTDAAIVDYSRAIAKDTPASYMGRALAYSRKGDKARAAADLARALQFDPNAQTRFAEFGLTINSDESAGAKQAAPR